MKAKEYFDKYGKELYNQLVENPIVGVNDIIKKIINDFLTDAELIIEQRKIKKGESVDAVINELNQKWNVFVNMFEKEYQTSVLARDGFKHFCISRKLHSGMDPRRKELLDINTLLERNI